MRNRRVAVSTTCNRATFGRVRKDPLFLLLLLSLFFKAFFFFSSSFLVLLLDLVEAHDVRVLDELHQADLVDEVLLFDLVQLRLVDDLDGHQMLRQHMLQGAGAHASKTESILPFSFNPPHAPQQA